MSLHASHEKHYVCIFGHRVIHNDKLKMQTVYVLPRSNDQVEQLKYRRVDTAPTLFDLHRRKKVKLIFLMIQNSESI